MPVIDVKTEIPGNIWKIVVKPGDAVAEDDPLMILESMKMEIPVLAPEAGTVVEITVAEGQSVGEDDTVAKLEA